MSREWDERKYCNSEDLWLWIDEKSHGIERDLEAAKEAAADSYKLLLMGRKEVLDQLCNWLHENETTLGDVAKLWALKKHDE